MPQDPIAVAPSVLGRIESTLRGAFAPTRLVVLDESHRHEGHAGARPGFTTHVRVEVVSDAFAGLSRVERHRRINALLQPEIDAGLHALAIVARAPGEG